MNEIVLVTSITPKNLENQKLAMNSWIENGFQIISCNSSDEILLIQNDFPQIEFIEVHRDAREVMGKPCPYIYDMLQILKKRIKGVGGIVNSDIHLRNFNRDMYNYLYQKIQNNVIFMRRHDIDKLEDALSLRSQMFFGGIDVFFFHKEVLNLIPDDGLILGQVMWDYWLPIVLKMEGVNVKEFINPVAFHIRHPIQWEVAATDTIAQHLCEKYFPQISKDDATFYLKNKFLELMSDRNLQICYVTKEMKKSKVVIQTDDECYEFHNQSHKEITVLRNDEHIFLSYKYLFKIPYHIAPCEVMVDLVIWILEQYGWKSLQLWMYWRGNFSDSLKIENCNQQMLEKFNTDILPISVTRYFDGEEIYNEAAPICSIYTCSVYVEEDTEKIWKTYQLQGNIYIYPAGYMAQTWIKRFTRKMNAVKICGFIDQSTEMQKKLVCGYHVYSPVVLNDLQAYDKVVIISNMYMDEIYQSLIKRIPEEKILIWNDEFDGKKWLKDREEIWSEVSC